MAAVTELVTLIVDGRALIGWQDVSIDRSMESAEISFNLIASNPSWSPEAKRLRYGRAVEVLTAPIGGSLGRPGSGDLMVAGYVTGYGAKYAPRTKTVTLEGKSKGADAVDCHPVKHKTGRFENKTLLQVAQDLDEVRCGFKADIPLKPLAKVQRQPGDTIFQTVEREARRVGAMLTGQPDGSILITRAGSKRHAGGLVLGFEPVEEMDVKIKCDQKFSPIVGRGQSAAGTGKDRNVEVQETDASVGRNRPLMILPEGDWSKKELKKRLKWERLRRASFGTTITVTVSAWRDGAGELWEPGRLMALECGPEDIAADYMLQSVNFRQGQQDGTRATLTFIDPKAAGAQKGGDGRSDAAFDPGGALDDEDGPE